MKRALEFTILALLACMTCSDDASAFRPQHAKMVTTRNKGGGNTPPSGGGAGTLAINATRTSGVAPLSVFFDTVSGTTLTNTSFPFHEALYVWDFDDSVGGATWDEFALTASGSSLGTVTRTAGAWSKNQAFGPMASHVFETAGTYVVTCTVYDITGASTLQTKTITVSDPDTFYSGTNTVCFSTAGTFTGCPAGATQTTVGGATFANVVSASGTNKRLLLRTGEAWTVTTGGASLAGTGGTLGTFGGGAVPTVTMATGGTFATLLSMGDNYRIVGIKFVGHGANSQVGSGLNDDVLLLRTTWDGFWQTWVSTSSISGFSAVDSTVINVTGGGGGYPVYSDGPTHNTYQGVQFTDAINVESTFRMGVHRYSVLSHNFFGPSGPGKAVLKIGAIAGSPSQYWLLSFNRILGGDGVVNIAPQNSTEDERISDAIMEYNYVSHLGANFIYVALGCACTDSTIRGNIVNWTDMDSGGTPITFNPRGIEPVPTRVRAYNNTVFRSGSGSVIGVNCDSGNNALLRNNLTVATGGGTATASSNSCSSSTVSNNTGMTSSPFTGTPPTSDSDRLAVAPSVYDLASSTTPIGAGTTPPAPMRDFNGGTRPISTWDTGAYEFGN